MALHHATDGEPEAAAAPIDWRRRLPLLTDEAVTLRALRQSDAPSLLHHVSDARVLQYITPSPATVEGFRRYARWTHRERRRGGLACFGIVPAGATNAVGVMQVWPIEPDFSTAEWGFALGTAFWGSGLFTRASRMFVDAVFSQLHVYRLEARSVDANLRGNRAFERLGARRDGMLRGAFRDGDVVRDHVMWSILAPEWRAMRKAAPYAH
jgi:RimJ/RimL family protein N-acetyltransferase